MPVEFSIIPVGGDTHTSGLLAEALKLVSESGLLYRPGRDGRRHPRSRRRAVLAGGLTFRDLKDIVGAGQQQVRRVRASVEAFHVCLWTFTMTEAWAWGRTRTPWSGTGACPRGTMTRGVRATRTSGGRGDGNCWPRKSTRFYGRD